MLGIAFGVALGVAVHLINQSAANEFALAVRTLSGEAHLLVRGPRAGFPDDVYVNVARLPPVSAASPGVEIEAQLAGRRATIKVLGLDVFRAGAMQRELLPESREAILELLKGDAIALSQPAADALGIRAGDTLRVQAASGIAALAVIAVLPAGASRQPLAIMDIATAQWRFGRLGTLHRIDLKLRPGTDLERFRASLQTLLPPGVLVMSPEAEAERSTSLSAAYRLNLDMLALVALFTGAFLVFSTQFLALLRRRTQLALLRVIGLTRARLVRLLIAEGAVVGVAGSALGIALGCLLAQYGIERLGGDLGAGYFRALHPTLDIAAAPLAVFFFLGVGFAVLGAAFPALEAARRQPALALKAGDEEEALRGMRLWPSLLLGAAALALSQAPSIRGLPIAGYLSIALLLIASILAMPRLAEAVLERLPHLRYAPAALAGAQLQATPRQVGVSLAAILASFSLMVSMVIMVGSFRVSLAQWLDQMLPADVYVRTGRSGDSGYFTAEEQARLAGAAGVREVVFIRSQNVLVRADRPAVTLLARPIGDSARATLPLVGREVRTRAPHPPVWLSEVAADLFAAQPGDRIELAIGNARRAFTVAGLWRDYARQNGAIVIDRAQYIALTGDDRANDAAVYLQAGVGFDSAARAIRSALSSAEGLELAPAQEVKAASLAIFDQTFAVTYALELAAVVIGLFGVSASFSAQALARRREFGVLRQLGMTRGQVAAMLGCEGFVVGTLGVAAGFAIGWLVSLILVHVINRQSFHWSMDMHLPWGTLAMLGSGLIALAAVTAMASGRRAMSDEVVRAVREDW